MRNVKTLIFLSLLSVSTAGAQTVAVQPTAEQTVQPSQSTAPDSTARQPIAELRVPAGTPIEVEVAYTVNSLEVKPGERISFRVLVPIVIDGVTVIERDALVTARVTQAKRGGHWGKAGKIVWSMEDVVAADNSRVPLAPETGSRSDKLWSLETRSTPNEPPRKQGHVTGTSHVGEVATMAALSGVLFPPLALIHGFKRGENAILSEGRRYVVAVARDTTVKITTTIAAP
ncbi:MAG: hypothetical protein ACRD9S_05580 [Pyrinomonadaceae bacterium]